MKMKLSTEARRRLKQLSTDPEPGKWFFDQTTWRWEISVHDSQDAPDVDSGYIGLAPLRQNGKQLEYGALPKPDHDRWGFLFVINGFPQDFLLFRGSLQEAKRVLDELLGSNTPELSELPKPGEFMSDAARSEIRERSAQIFNDDADKILNQEGKKRRLSTDEWKALGAKQIEARAEQLADQAIAALPELVAEGLLEYATDAQGQQIYHDGEPVLRMTAKGLEVKRLLKDELWKEHVILGINHVKFHKRRVGELNAAELAIIESQWLPAVREQWDDATDEQRADAAAFEAAMLSPLK
jgi:hypothetical protein